MAHIDCCVKDGKVYEVEILCEKCSKNYCEICIENHICENKILDVKIVFDNNSKNHKCYLVTKEDFISFKCDYVLVKRMINALKEEGSCLD